MGMFNVGVLWNIYAVKNVDDYVRVKTVVLKTVLLVLVLIASWNTASMYQPFFEDSSYNIVALVGLVCSLVVFTYLVRLKTKFTWLFALLMSINEGVIFGVLIGLFKDGIFQHALMLSLRTILGVFFGLTVLYLGEILRKGLMRHRVVIGLISGLLPAGLLAGYYTIENGLYEGTVVFLYIGVFLLSFGSSTVFLIEDFNQVTKHLHNKISYKYEFLLTINLLLGILLVYVKFAWMLLYVFFIIRRSAVESRNRRKNIKTLYPGAGSYYDFKHNERTIKK